jgi:hypothetical protein
MQLNSDFRQQDLGIYVIDSMHRSRHRFYLLSLDLLR